VCPRTSCRYSTDGQVGSFEALQTGVAKLLLTDPSVSTQREYSKALGQGLRCGFLGLLHMDVFVQRLEQEYNVDVLVTSPTVPFKAKLESGEEKIIETPDDFVQSVAVQRCAACVRACVRACVAYLPACVRVCTTASNDVRRLVGLGLLAPPTAPPSKTTTITTTTTTTATTATTATTTTTTRNNETQLHGAHGVGAAGDAARVPRRGHHAP
jgi:hypothetical protein